MRREPGKRFCQIKADDGNLCHIDVSFRALCCDVTMTIHGDATKVAASTPSDPFLSRELTATLHRHDLPPLRAHQLSRVSLRGEVLGVERRRRWSDEDKLSIV